MSETSSLEATVREFQTGNRSAFESLVNRYQDFVISVAYSLIGDLGRSEDVAQQAFVTAWQKQGELKEPSRFGGWIRSITRNLARNEQRKTQRQNTLQTDNTADASLQSDEPGPLETSIASEQSKWLWTVLEEIPEHYREPMVMYYRESQPVAKIAELLDLSQDTVKQRLARGRKALREEIANVVEESLGEQKASPSFAVGVLTAISSTLAGQASGGAAATGSGAIAATTGASTASTTGWAASAVAGGLGGLFGVLIGIGGAVYGSKKSLDSATSKPEKEFMWKMIVGSSLLVVLMLAWMLGTSFLFPALYKSAIAQGIVWTVYSITLVWLVIWGNARIQEIKKVHGTETERKGIAVEEAKPVSFAGMCANMIGSAFGCWFWLILLAGLSKAWILMTISLLLFASLTATGCLLARNATTVIRQLTLTGQFALATTTAVAIVVLTGWSAIELVAGQFANGYVSGWLLALMIIGIGIAISQLLFWRARRFEESLAMKQSAREQD